MKFFVAMLLFVLNIMALNFDTTEGSGLTLSLMDSDTNETSTVQKEIHSKHGFFGFEAYEKNFFMPFAYNKDKPPRVFKALPAGTIDDNFYPEYDSHVEIEYQFSLNKQVSYDLLGFKEYLYFAYTQKSWWQAYIDSAPFRETNYKPEVYLLFPASQKMNEDIGLKRWQLGFMHESNGQEGFQSRSWNRFYLTGHWQFGNLFLSTRAWYKLPETDKQAGFDDPTSPNFNPNDKGDDNADISEYLGYGDLKFHYLYDDIQLDLLVRNNLRFNSQNKGAYEFGFLKPITGSKSTYWYVEVFYGYGASLIDYNREVTKISAGFAFSRGLF